MMACTGDNMAKTNMMMTHFWESADPHGSESSYIAAPCPAPFNPTP
jgi:hypothetical protein